MFRNTASAICYSIIQNNFPQIDPAVDFPHNKVVNFVLEQHSRMPDFLRFPIICLTLIFDLAGIIQAGSLFHSQSPIQRWRQIESWKNSPIGPLRDLIRFYESLVIFDWFSSCKSYVQISERQSYHQSAAATQV
ncbi:hypothetical protein [Brasilonema sp. UFV-L1]|uniref:hypothetical protein n=1 Tax=Brasilonema sp. UFV-L1 TaxID=2234130 RepID=UPI001B7CF3DC|nr:hypothetical protein [Brasilonema sp. UFV-L1]